MSPSTTSPTPTPAATPAPAAKTATVDQQLQASVLSKSPNVMPGPSASRTGFDSKGNHIDASHPEHPARVRVPNETDEDYSARMKKLDASIESQKAANDPDLAYDPETGLLMMASMLISLVPSAESMQLKAWLEGYNKERNERLGITDPSTATVETEPEPAQTGTHTEPPTPSHVSGPVAPVVPPINPGTPGVSSPAPSPAATSPATDTSSGTK